MDLRVPAVYQDFVHASCHRLIAKSLCVSEREKRTEPAYSLAEHAGCLFMSQQWSTVMLPWGLFTTPTETGEPKRYRRERQEVQMICIFQIFSDDVVFQDQWGLMQHLCRSFQKFAIMLFRIVLTHFSKRVSAGTKPTKNMF